MLEQSLCSRTQSMCGHFLFVLEHVVILCSRCGRFELVPLLRFVDFENRSSLTSVLYYRRCYEQRMHANDVGTETQVIFWSGPPFHCNSNSSLCFTDRQGVWDKHIFGERMHIQGHFPMNLEEIFLQPKKQNLSFCCHFLFHNHFGKDLNLH